MYAEPNSRLCSLPQASTCIMMPYTTRVTQYGVLRVIHNGGGTHMIVPHWVLPLFHFHSAAGAEAGGRECPVKDKYIQVILYANETNIPSLANPSKHGIIDCITRIVTHIKLALT